MDLTSLGKLLMTVGAVIAVLGGLVFVIGRGILPRLHLPGDLSFQWGSVRFFFPLATSLLLSVLLTLILNLIAKR